MEFKQQIVHEHRFSTAFDRTISIQWHDLRDAM